MTENINSHNDNKILLIDDDQTVLRDLEEMFTSWGYQVTCVNGIQHAMNTIKQDWHCVISDWNLGDGCGEDIIKYCYKNSIPSILISSNKSKDLLRLAQDYNSQLLQKPISPSRLRAKLLSIK
jgi:DNA-binding NtrC family response regulator